MGLMEIELNLLSLGAMALAVGMVVDSSVVLLENFNRIFSKERMHGKVPLIEVILSSIKEVKSSIIASLLTSIIVFVPLFFAEPLAKSLLVDLASVIVCTLIVSLFITLFLLPSWLYLVYSKSIFMKLIEKNFMVSLFQNLVEKSKQLYINLLFELFEKRWKRNSFLLFVLIIFLLASYLSVFTLRKEVLPVFNSNIIIASIHLKDKPETEDQIQNISAYYRERIKKEITLDLTEVFEFIGKQHTQIFCLLKDKYKQKYAKEQLERLFKNDLQYSIRVYDWKPNSLKLPKYPDLRLRASSHSLEENLKNLVRLQESLRKSKIFSRSEINPQASHKEVNVVEWNKEIIPLLREKPMLERDIKNILLAATSSEQVKTMNINNKNVVVNLQVKQSDFSNSDDILNKFIRVKNKIIPIRHFLTLTKKKQAQALFRENGQRLERISLYAYEYSKHKRSDLVTELWKIVDEDNSLERAMFFLEEENTEIQDNINSLVKLLLLAVLCICIVLSWQFVSYQQIFVVMISVPLAFVGSVFFSLYIW